MSNQSGSPYSSGMIALANPQSTASLAVKRLSRKKISEARRGPRINGKL